jgi:ketosteroid isomerase-like protein
MSRENVEIVRRIYDDLSRGDLEAVVAQLAAGVEWDTQARGSDGAVVRGIEDVAKGTREWLDAWEDASFELREVRDAGAQIAAHVRQHATAKISGIEGDVDAFASFRISNGKIVGYREHSTWSAALEAVGLAR